MALGGKQKNALRKMAHTLRPVVMIGQAGLTEGVIDETIGRLAHHELIKVKVSAGDRERRQQLVETLCQRCEAELVQVIGAMAVLYRPARPPVIKLPR